MGILNASNLPFEIIHIILDELHRSEEFGRQFGNYYSHKRVYLGDQLANKMLINRHWAEAVRDHAVYAQFYEPDCLTIDKNINELSLLCNWLKEPHRRNRVIDRLHVYFHSFTIYQCFVTVMEHMFPDVIFKEVVLGFTTADHSDESFDCDLKLPRTLKTFKLSIHPHLTYDTLYGCLSLDWSSISDNRFLQENLRELSFTQMCHINVPSHSFLRALRRVDIESIFKQDFHAGLLVLIRNHPGVKKLTLECVLLDYTDLYVDDDEYRWDWGSAKISLGDIQHVEVLRLFEINVDLAETDTRSLKHLSKDYIDDDQKWRQSFPNTLEVLELDRILDSFYLPTEANLRELVDLKRFYLNLTSKTFVDRFNEGHYDDIMPHLEELGLFGIELPSVKALASYTSKHSRLQNIHTFVGSIKSPFTADDLKKITSH